MKEVIGLIVTQVRVFAVDTIPVRRINTRSCIERIKNDFQLDEVELGLPPVGRDAVAFGRGEIKEKDSTLVINRIAVESRKIILEVAGTSRECAQVYRRLVKSMGAATGTDLTKLERPIVLAETTQCVVKLDFGFDSLLNDSFGEFVYTKVAGVASSDVARASIRPLQIEFEVGYNVKSRSLIDNHVALAPKRITIGARAGTPLKERWFFTYSPFDSDTHLRLIRDLERIITSKYPARVNHRVAPRRK